MLGYAAEAQHTSLEAADGGSQRGLASALGLLPDGMAACTVLFRSHCPAGQHPPSGAPRLTQALIPCRDGVNELGRGLPGVRPLTSTELLSDSLELSINNSAPNNFYKLQTSVFTPLTQTPWNSQSRITARAV